MNVRRSILAATVCTALLVGCSSEPKVTVTKPTSGSSSTKASTPSTEDAAADSPSAPLDPQACADVAEGQLDLLVATSTADATTAADKLKAHDPPASVLTAIDHFVDSGGIQFDDPDATKYSDTVKKWVEGVCPS